ncbi:MAG TPA: efflux transporter outer membrane subunit [Burkholderiaceae bacterium]
MSKLHFCHRIGLTIGSVAWLAGCAVGPDYHRPESPAAAYLPAPVEAAMRDERQVVDADLPAQWWTLFHSPALDELVRGALARSPSVAAAQAALRQATELRRAQQASFFPTVDASYSASRQKVARPLASPLASNADLFNLSTAQLSVSYTPDLFGMNRRQVESLQAQEQAQRWNVEATYLTLSSNLVVAVITEASLHAQFEATTRQIALQSEVLARFRELERLGENSELDVAQQESQLAALQATLPGVYKQMVQQRDLVKALAGLPPTADVPEPTLDDLTLPDPLPLTLPSTLVEHRPDVLAAEAQLQSASADIGVAVANRLPQVTLGVNTWGSSAASLSGLFAPGTSFWTLAGGVTQPLFDGGALKHKEDAARAAYDQAEATYRATVINAFQNVADALQAVQADAEAERATWHALDLADRTLAIARRQLELGDISALAVSQSEQARQQALVGYVQARAQRLQDAAALLQSLGGGWWNREHAQAARD